MDRFDILEKKVHTVAAQLTALKQEREKLLAELKFLEEENKRTKDLIKENESLRDGKKTIAGRIEKILKKINSLTR